MPLKAIDVSHHVLYVTDANYYATKQRSNHDTSKPTQTHDARSLLFQQDTLTFHISAGISYISSRPRDARILPLASKETNVDKAMYRIF